MVVAADHRPPGSTLHRVVQQAIPVLSYFFLPDFQEVGACGDCEVPGVLGVVPALWLIAQCG
jgi:hypothetical protein